MNLGLTVGLATTAGQGLQASCLLLGTLARREGLLGEVGLPRRLHGEHVCILCCRRCLTVGLPLRCLNEILLILLCDSYLLRLSLLLLS